MAKKKNLAEEKMKDNLGKRYSKLAIWSFVLGLIGLFLSTFLAINTPSVFIYEVLDKVLDILPQSLGALFYFLVWFISPILSIIFGIIGMSLNIKIKGNLKDRILAIIGIIISALVLFSNIGGFE